MKVLNVTYDSNNSEYSSCGRIQAAYRRVHLFTPYVVVGTEDTRIKTSGEAQTVKDGCLAGKTGI